jgi:hypothetical protein
MYVVELLGFNDGTPYEKFSSTDVKAAQVEMQALRKQHPRVGYRLIQVLEEYEPLERFYLTR